MTSTNSRPILRPTVEQLLDYITEHKYSWHPTYLREFLFDVNSMTKDGHITYQSKAGYQVPADDFFFRLITKKPIPYFNWFTAIHCETGEVIFPATYRGLIQSEQTNYIRQPYLGIRDGNFDSVFRLTMDDIDCLKLLIARDMAEDNEFILRYVVSCGDGDRLYDFRDVISEGYHAWMHRQCELNSVGKNIVDFIAKRIRTDKVTSIEEYIRLHIDTFLNAGLCLNWLSDKAYGPLYTFLPYASILLSKRNESIIDEEFENGKFALSKAQFYEVLARKVLEIIHDLMTTPLDQAFDYHIPEVFSFMIS